jgi:DNA-binding MarR family transcriptional regulator
MSVRGRDVREDVADRFSDESRPAVVVARTLAWPSGDLSVHEFGALALLATDGPQTAATIARRLGAPVSFHGLVTRGLVVRASPASDDHEDLTMLSTGGRRIVEHFLAHRRREIEMVMAYAIGDDATAIAAALAQSARATGERSQIDAEQLTGTRSPVVRPVASAKTAD